ncbi:hypothetical protein EKD16_23100 [Streptomonospora litoralis]|uniref:Uncharacterized protein n=1 Tax=Streptomonospora litoralis TaxID=2498135 RepID=A0A4P6Q6R8_9ACTN|nr:hypothetical protein EKD16_23100 [Streptomonospora litoralis]
MRMVPPVPDAPRRRKGSSPRTGNPDPVRLSGSGAARGLAAARPAARAPGAFARRGRWRGRSGVPRCLCRHRHSTRRSGNRTRHASADTAGCRHTRAAARWHPRAGGGACGRRCIGNRTMVHYPMDTQFPVPTEMTPWSRRLLLRARDSCPGAPRHVRRGRGRGVREGEAAATRAAQARARARAHRARARRRRHPFRRCSVRGLGGSGLRGLCHLSPGARWPRGAHSAAPPSPRTGFALASSPVTGSSAVRVGTPRPPTCSVESESEADRGRRGHSPGAEDAVPIDLEAGGVMGVTGDSETSWV